MSDLKRLSDGCRVKADLYARAHPEIPKSFIWIADEIDRILGVAQTAPDPWTNAIDPDARTPGDDLGPSELIRIELRQAMLDCWNSICADTDCHPLDIKHQGKKLFFTPDHWADMVAAELANRLSHHATFASVVSSTPAQCSPDLTSQVVRLRYAILGYLEVFDRCGGSESVSPETFAAARHDLRDAVAFSSTVPSPAALDQYEFPYQQTFEAIAAATEIYPSKEQALGLSISVKKFQEAFNGHRDRRSLKGVVVTSTDKSGAA